MKARVWGSAFVLAAVCAVSSGCSLALRGVAVGYRSSSSSSSSSSATTTSSGPVNLVSNGSFESGAWGWQPIPNSRITLTNSPHLDWSQALLILPTSGRVPWFGAYTIIGYIGRSAVGRTYLGHAWVRGNWSSSAVVHLQLFTVRKGPNGYISVVVGERTRLLKGGWQRLSVHGTITYPQRTQLELRIWAAGSVKQSSQLVVDGVGAKIVPTRQTHEKPPAAQKGHS